MKFSIIKSDRELCALVLGSFVTLLVVVGCLYAGGVKFTAEKKKPGCQCCRRCECPGLREACPCK